MTNSIGQWGRITSHEGVVEGSKKVEPENIRLQKDWSSIIRKSDMKSHERKIILVLSSPGGQNHSLVPSFIHSFTQQSSVEHLPLFIKPGSRGTRVKPILPAPKETYSLVGMKVKFQFSKTCVYVFHDALLLWAGVAHWQCAASYVVLFHCPEF